MSILNRLRARLRQRVDRVAAGSNPPAGEDLNPEVGERRPTARERGDMRRRLREVARRREELLLELGALAFELHRRDRQNPRLVRRKVAALTALGSEAAALAGALATTVPVIERPAGSSSRLCSQCDAVLLADWAYCARCGAAAEPIHESAPETPDRSPAEVRRR